MQIGIKHDEYHYDGHSRVLPLHAAPSSRHIVKPTWYLCTVDVSVTTVVLRTANNAVMRCEKRLQCGAKLAVLHKFSQSNLAQK